MGQINTEGGTAVGRDVGTGGGNFIGRDRIKESVTNVVDVMIPRESFEHILALRQQVDRLEQTLTLKLTLFERDLEQTRRDLTRFQNDVLQAKAEWVLTLRQAASQPVEVAAKREPMSQLQLVTLLTVMFLLSMAIAVGLVFLLKVSR